MDDKYDTFRKELEVLINKYSMENNSDTPDFIQAEFIEGCLKSWDKSVKMRDKWYSFDPWAKVNSR